MSLKITLKPNERLIIGGAVVTNGNKHPCNLVIENDAPVLREKDILSEKEADSPCSRIYFVIQLMYIDQENLSVHHESYWNLVRPLVQAVPRLTGLVDQISEKVINGKYYLALKLAGQLIAFEEEISRHV
jgi:flagellar protein FlbT